MSQKKDNTSPIVALELILITSPIDAHKSRDVSVIYIHGAYLTADMNKDSIVVLHLRLVEIMVKLNQASIESLLQFKTDVRSYM